MRLLGSTLRRFEDDVSGTSDANGNITLLWHGMTGQFGSLLLIAQAVAGSPYWTVKINGSPVNVGRGINSPLRLPVLHPGDAVVVVGSGVQPLTQVTGHFVGYAADGIDELPIAPPEPSTIAMETSSPQEKMGTTTAAAGAIGNKTFVLPPQTLAVGIAVDPVNHPAGAGGVQLVGAQSGVQYFAVDGITIPGVFNRGNWYIVPVAQSLDSSVILSVDNTGGATATSATAIAFGWAAAVSAFNPTGEPVSVTNVGPPTVWQVPNKQIQPFNISFAAVGIQHIIAAPGGSVVIRLFDINGDINATAAVAGAWQDTNGNLIDTINASALGGPRQRHWSGVALPIGAGLDFNVIANAAAPNYSGGVSYSQL